ncbi:MAG: tetratricopeptide repeat protein [Bacteroidetes bacterium]|nr:tetratricopeptide repeat protein [Bacteroidota bacterium]
MKNSVRTFLFFTGIWFLSACAGDHGKLNSDTIKKSGSLRYQLPRSRDSLYTIYNNSSLNDTLRLAALGNFAQQLQQTDPDSGCIYSNRVLNEAVKKKIPVCEARGLNALGVNLETLGKYTEAIEAHNKALVISRSIGDSLGEADALANLGNNYFRLSDYPRAIDYQLQSLKIREETRDRPGEAGTLNKIGNIYLNTDDCSRAMDYYSRSLHLYDSLKNQRGIAVEYGNLGLVYQYLPDSLCAAMKLDQRNKILKALDYQQRSLAIREKINDKQGIATAWGNIGNIYTNIPDSQSAYLGVTVAEKYSKALECQQKNLELVEEIGDKYGIANSLLNIGNIEMSTAKLDEAEKNLQTALVKSGEIKAGHIESDALLSLSQLYEKENRTNDAFVAYKRYVVVLDSAADVEKQKEIARKQVKFEFEKKAAADSVRNTEEKRVKDVQIRNEKMLRYGLFGGLAIVLLFSVFLYNRFSVTRKQKNIIAEQIHEVETQKAIVDEKNKSITDSINYARRIQRAMLTSEGYMKKHLPDYFILYLPKDIVSGDFYWMFASRSGKITLATADCTGHGVPGALMSMIGISLLNEIVVEKKIKSPSQILDMLREEIIRSLNPEDAEEESNDGLDISICSMDLIRMSMEYAGANNAIYIVRNNKLVEYNPDHFPAGKHTGELQAFTNHEIPLEPGDLIYTFTDGYADQFGGPKGKKIKYKQLQQLLVECSELPLEEQRKVLEKKFTEWKRHYEQVDDVLLIGVKV